MEFESQDGKFGICVHRLIISMEILKMGVFHSLIFFLLFARALFAFNPITDFLKPEVVCLESDVDFIDAAFVIDLKDQNNLEEMRKRFRAYGISLGVYDKYDHISDELINEFCSPKISPKLLKQYLSHLSIFQLCLRKKIKTALIVEDRAQIVKDPYMIKRVISKLEKAKLSWDLIFTDEDFHHPETGNLIVPCINNRENKFKLDSCYSRLGVRYGTTAYVISSSGMKKILRYYDKNWKNLPYDQELFSIPNLDIYSINTDVITNLYKTGSSAFDANKKHPFYACGTQFWIDPLDLLSYDRFDIMAPYIYSKYCLNQRDLNYHIQIYNSYINKCETIA